MFKITLKSLNNVILAIILITSLACSEEGTEPTDGVDGTNGFNALVEVQNEDAGDNCSQGGVKISVGQDSNENGILDESEIVSVSFVCNGSAGENGNTLVARTSPEIPGENCENGGTLVEIGADANGNNSLDNDEVQTSFFVCNGLDGADGSGEGANGLTSLIRATPLEDCGSNGSTGIRIEIGLDSNGNGVLDNDPNEVQSTYEICDGSDGLNAIISCTTLPTRSSECPDGGIQIEVGLDANSNGILDEGESIGEPKYICNGADGQDGRSPITTTTTDVSCTNGGIEISFGFDNNGDDVIDELLETITICNGEIGATGADGYNTIIETNALLQGDTNCPSGGTEIRIGLDLDRDGVIDETGGADNELISTQYICNGNNSLVAVSTFTGNAGTCNTNDGGIRIDVGVDDDGDGILDPSEIDDTQYICNGDDGADGSDGNTDGIYEIFIYDGFNSYDQTQDTYIYEGDRGEVNYDGQGVSVSSGDTNFRFGLLRFDRIDEVVLGITSNYEILETQIYLTGQASAQDENYVGVKELFTPDGNFDQRAATYQTPDGIATWANGNFSVDEGDASTSFMDTYQLLPAAFEGIVPLRLNRSLVNSWVSTPSTNQGLLLQMVSTANTKQIDFYDAENEDRFLRPVLYIKIQDLNVAGRVSINSEEEYITRWKSMSYEEKLAPILRRSRD